MQKIFLGLALLVLLIAVAMQAYQIAQPPPTPTKLKPLKESVPAILPGWHGKDLPLGQTEAVQYRVNKLLQLDDFVYREFSKGDLRFFIYVAYWQPGKMPVRLINAHNPDRCWTESGWSCTAMKFNLTKTLAEGKLQPAQWRIFEKGSFRQHVLFWHIVGNKVYSYRRFNDRPPLTVVLHDVIHNGFNQKREQYFVRISSDQSFERLWQESGFQLVMRQLMDLCLAYPNEEEERV